MACALAYAVSASAYAETLPSVDPYGDAAQVELIVEGRVVGEDRVTIVRTLFAAKPLDPDVREIWVVGLSKHDRHLGGIGDFGDAPTLETSDVVLLLDRDEKAGSWHPHNLFVDRTGADRGIGGATGTLWLKDGAVWGYEQRSNPGPLALQRWQPYAKLPGTPETLRDEIAKGVAARRAWESDLAIADPAERARRLVRWLQPSTSPDGERRTRRVYAVRSETRKLGKAAVPALVAALNPSFDDKARDEALATLADLGEAAKEAIPRLLEVAAEPGSHHRGTIAYALRYAGDERAIAPLRKILAESALSDDAVEHASFGLVRLRDSEAAERIAAKLPKSLDGLELPYALLKLLESLAEVDAVRMKAWLAPRATDVLFRHARDQVDRLLTRREGADGPKQDR